MWVIGTIMVVMVNVAATTALGWTPRATPGSPLWDTSKLGGTFAGSAGTFAGFSLAATIFIAGRDGARTSVEFASVFGMMLIGFLILVVASWIAGSAPNGTHAEDGPGQSLALVLGSLCGDLGVAITWLALAPLMAVIGLSWLADVFIWPLLIMALAGGGWAALVVFRLTRASARACLVIPVLGLALPALYRLVAVRLWPSLWPAHDAALLFAFVALGAAGLLFALYLGLLATHGNATVQERLCQDGHRIALAASQAYVAVVGLTWLAVARL